MRAAVIGALLALAACSKPAPAPVAPSCPAGPKLATAEDMEAMDARTSKCDDATCREQVLADYSDYAIPISLVIEASKKTQHRGSAALQELRDLQQDACACTDAACANGVQTDFEAWAKRHADTHGSEAEAEEAGKIAEAISECMVKAMSGDSP